MQTTGRSDSCEASRAHAAGHNIDGARLKINRSLKYACPTSQPAGSDFCRGTGGAAVPAVTRRALTGVAEAGDEAAGGGGSRGGRGPVAP